MTKDEKELWREEAQKKSNFYIDELPHRLKQEFSSYNKLYEYYINKK